MCIRDSNDSVKFKLGFFALRKEADAALFAEFFGTQHLQVVKKTVAVGNELLLRLVCWVGWGRFISFLEDFVPGMES